MSTIAITGATRGIGRALLDRYRGRGDTLLATTRGNVAQADTPGVTWVDLDVAKPEMFTGLRASLSDVSLDLLVCNAGVYLDKGAAIGNGFSAKDWAETFAVNVTGVFLTIEAALPALRRAAAPKIAILGSAMGSDARAPGGSYIYRSSKAAVLNLGRNLATDLKDDGIAVGVYHPGWVDTDMGGPQADTALADSVTGLVREFDSLDLSRTGCFRSFDGHDQPF